MYSGEKAISSPAAEAPQNGPIPESGPAVEVIELANGETIWCVFIISPRSVFIKGMHPGLLSTASGTKMMMLMAMQIGRASRRNTPSVKMLATAFRCFSKNTEGKAVVHPSYHAKRSQPSLDLKPKYVEYATFKTCLNNAP